MNYRFNISVFLLGLLTFNTFSQETNLFQLKTGLLEGVSESSFSYKLVEFNDNGQHRMFNLNITSAFKKGEARSFSDSDINCSISECIINISNNSNLDGNTRLIITPYLNDYFKVIEIQTDKDGKAILSETYQLDKQKNQSTPRKFVDMYKGRIESLNSIDKTDIYGFWLGVLNIDDIAELISIEINPDSRSRFVRFVNGSNIINDTYFTPANITKVGDVINIQTEHPTFANKILLHQNNSVLEGYMYSTHKGVTLQKGVFRLYRMRK